MKPFKCFFGFHKPVTEKYVAPFVMCWSEDDEELLGHARVERTTCERCKILLNVEYPDGVPGRDHKP